MKFLTVYRRLTYANIVVTFAFVFAVSGGAYAASKYVITSTKQISPQVLKVLKGAAGPMGREGREGVSWNPGGVLPHGKTETGTWGFSTHEEGAVVIPISFQIPLENPLGEDNMVVVKPGEEGKEDIPECPGTVADPKAEKGYLCLYSEILAAQFYGDAPPHRNGINAVFYARTESKGGLGMRDEGTWAVTAP